MKKPTYYFNRIHLLFLVFLFTAASCKQTDKIGKLVPADAGVVIHVNGNRLSDKLSWQEIRNTDWFKDMYTQGKDSVAKKLMDDPESSGIDTKADLIFFTKQQGNGGYFAFTGTIKDAKAFEAFNKNISKENSTKADGYSSIAFGKDGVVTWNDDRFIYITNAPATNPARMNVGYDQDEPAYQSSFTPDSLRLFAKQLFVLDGDNSLGRDDKFTDMIKEDGDMHFYINYGEMYSNMAMGMMSMMKMNLLFEGNIAAATINFDDGRITMKSKQYYGKELSDLLEKYDSKKIDKAILNRIPSKDVVAVFAMNYPPQGIKEFTKLIGVDGMVNGFLGEVNYSIEEFQKANKGDLLIVVSDFSVSKLESENVVPGEPPVRSSRNMPDVKVLFATSVNDRAAFDKLISTFKKEKDKMGEIPSIPSITYSLNNDWFAASNSQDYVNQFLAGGDNNHPFTEKLSGHSYGGYMDIQKLLKGMKAWSNDTTTKSPGFDASIAMWQDAWFTAGEYKNGSISAEGVINLVDKKTNSLKQLNQYINTISKSFRETKRSWEPQEETIPVPEGQ
jgi:hypothetical protein